MNREDIDYSFTVIDDDGYTWYWDGKRIYALDVDDPEDYIGVEFEHLPARGYEAKTWKDALHCLVLDGYISEDEEDWQTRPTDNSGEYKDWFDPKESYLPDY
jgi:hypothetical protein